MASREGDSRVRAALETLWSSRGEDISEFSPLGQRLKWMRQQADRLDHLVESHRPFSTADMKFVMASSLDRHFPHKLLLRGYRGICENWFARLPSNLTDFLGNYWEIIGQKDLPV